MKIEVDETIVSRATKCKSKFGCLNSDKKVFCKIDKSIGDVIFVSAEKCGLHCDYMLPFGSSFICVCPIRNEIFRKYKV
jgi:hypothetical protein